MSRNNGMSAVDKCYVQLYLIERSCTIEGSRSQTREVTRWNLKIKAFLINARKIPGVKDTGLKKGRVPFSHVSPLLCAACIPHSSYTISFPSLLLPVISVISTTSPPFNLDSPQMPRLRFRIPFVARRHTWRMLAVTSRTCAELLRKEPARYNRSLFVEYTVLGETFVFWVVGSSKNWRGKYEQMLGSHTWRGFIKYSLSLDLLSRIKANTLT